MSREDGEKARDEGIGRTARKNAWWLPYAVDAIREVALIREFFTSDAVWFVLERDEIPEPSDRRALSPALRLAEKDGICEKTPQTKKSERKIAHVGPKLIYKSLIYREGNGAPVRLSPTDRPPLGDTAERGDHLPGAVQTSLLEA